ncbi:longitudinals lacking protein, isoforms H/M/V isoform X2 [Sitodiplosis mosellana]|uniref:longitudinals lacking protein, isoforms H/M/V isoform X2 n=1 Tax=Sitodiplosis mosellana TaxID=263140 RepID=UPI002443AE16|nr:longitudinals lacking protein, isoforms H/M/V isoform X2 [Sitodiplosis mosellana]
MSVQQFCLRWNNHQPNFISVFSSLLHNEALVDVTLAAEGRQLQAHKVVLSACSSYFQSLFTTNPCQHPIVILKDVQYNDLKTMVDFMYYGEVNVSQEQLPHILKTAEMLKIKGLAEMPDPVSLTKSESKSSDQTDPNVQNSGVESMWGSSESQQYHQQTLQHQTSHQSQQQQSQRRSPTPGTISPSANRRKRLRKASTAGSGSASTERTSEEHSSIEGQADATNQPHDATHENVDAGNHSHHIHQISYIKKSDELSNVSQQQMPIDITSPTTPSDHGTSVSCSQSQTPHARNLVVPGTKRGRQLIRQSRIKKDIDPSQMPSSPDDIDYERSSSPYSSHNRLSAVAKMERHVSEPSPRLSSQSPPPSSSAAAAAAMHLLTVPHAPILTKQHSAPSHSICDTQFSYHRQESHSHFSLHRQLSLPSAHSPPPDRSDPFTIAEEKEPLSLSSGTGAGAGASGSSSSSHSLRPMISTSISITEPKSAHDLSPTFVVVSEPTDQPPPMRVRSEELQRSVSSPQHLLREISLENRSQHCPVIRPGPALGCNFCWNTIDAHGRILRRKTKYHCPECQTNLCIVPCFQEYHERQNSNEPSTSSSNDTAKNLTTPSGLRHHPKSSSLS